MKIGLIVLKILRFECWCWREFQSGKCWLVGIQFCRERSRTWCGISKAQVENRAANEKSSICNVYL